MQRRVRTLVLEPTRLAQPGSLERASAATMESIAESTGRACANGTLGVRIGIGRFCKPNVQNNRPARLFAQIRWIAELGLADSTDEYGAYPLMNGRFHIEKTLRTANHLVE